MVANVPIHIVVAVDDVHYADAASQLFLSHLLRRLASISGMIVVCECGRPRTEASPFLAQLERSPFGHAIQLVLKLDIAAGMRVDDRADVVAIARQFADGANVGNHPAAVLEIEPRRPI